MNLKLGELKNIINDFKRLDSYELKKEYYKSLKKYIKLREFWEEVFHYYEQGRISRDDLKVMRDEGVKNELSKDINHYVSCLANDLRFQVLKRIGKRPQSSYDLFSLITTSRVGHVSVEQLCIWLNTIGLCEKDKYGFRSDNRGWKYSMLEHEKKIAEVITTYTDNFIRDHHITFSEISYLIGEQYSKKPSIEVTKLNILLDIYGKENQSCFVHEMMSTQKRESVRIDVIINELEEKGYLTVEYLYNMNSEKPYLIEDIKNNYVTFFNRKLEECSQLATLEDVEKMSNSVVTYIRNKYYCRDVLNRSKKKVTLNIQGNLCGEFFIGIYDELKKEIPELKYYT